MGHLALPALAVLVATDRCAPNVCGATVAGVDEGVVCEEHTVHVGRVVDGEPAVLTDVDESMDAYREELFGPVAVVYKARDIEHAIKIANDVPFGLGASIQTQDAALAADIADKLEVGMVTINAPSGSEANTPFGGVKRSGFGRELGTLGITEFLNYKLIRDKS